MKDVLDQLLAGSTDYANLRPDIWRGSHGDAVRSYRTEERRDRADRKQLRRLRPVLDAYLHRGKQRAATESR
ncbi:MAG: hypothetical protein HQ567_20700 [Candidatus Nealsonbacteria bacterium]|nr:hypothetical protein [Candidatus Nealsonbacteria bacterium]